MILEKQDTLKRWARYCNSQGLQKEAQAVRLGLAWYDFDLMLRGKREFPQATIDKMNRLVDGRDILDQTVLETALLVDAEKYVKRSINEKLMITLAAPTGQGKSISAKYLANKYSMKYIQVLTEIEKKKVASKRNFIRDISRAYNVNERSTNGLRHLINEMQSDTRTCLIIDEAQRLITEDWGYFKVLQDLLDNVPNLSIILLGNYRFYNDMFTDSDRVYMGVSDQEQFLRRISLVHKLPRLTKADVKLWCEYNNINLKPSDHLQLAEFFSVRAALSDLENVRKEIIRVMGVGTIKSWNDVDASTMTAIYRRIHGKVKEGNSEAVEERESRRSAEVAA